MPRWMQFLFRRGQLERELDRELRYHLDRRTAELISGGAAPDGARRQALLEFGGVTQTKEDVRGAWFTRWIEDLFRDLAYAARVLLRSPGFTAVAVLSLALGIGANTAIFSLIDALLIRMMPVRDPARLVQLSLIWEGGPSAFSNPMYERFRDNATSFDGVIAQNSPGRREVTLDREPEDARVELVSANYHAVLGVTPAAGRMFTPRDHSAPVAVLSHAYWQRRFAADPAVVGRTLRLNRQVFTVIGVSARGFQGTKTGQVPDITFPLGMDGAVRGGRSWLAEPNYHFLSVMGRLRSGVSAQSAQAEATLASSVVAQEEAARIEGNDFLKKLIAASRVDIVPAGNGFDDLRRQFSQPLLILMGITGLVLLLACANLANLLLARAVARQSELGVRMAIGAGRGRIVRQLLTEAGLLAATGGVAGVALAYWLSDLLVVMMSNGDPRMPIDASPDLAVLSFAVAVTLGSCLLFALLPALRATSGNVNPAVKEARFGRWRIGRAMVVGQVAISAVLLVSAGLFLRTLWNLRTLDTGVRPQGLTVFGLNAKKADFPPEQLRALMVQAHDRLGTITGVDSAGFLLFPPLSAGGWTASLVVEGYQYPPNENRDIHMNEASPALFRTMGTPVLLGREFAGRDTSGAPQVAVVNDAFARHYYGGRSPLGKRLLPPQGVGRPLEIVGLVEDVNYESLRQLPPPTIYTSAFASPEPQDYYAWMVQSSLPAAALRNAIDATLREIHPSLRATNLRTFEGHLDRTILRERMLATLSGFFGALALALAALGIYGVLSFQVARRTNEIGIRIALGARPVGILWLILRDIGVLVVAGLIAGLAASLPLARLAASILFRLEPFDPLTVVLAACTLAGAALLAAYLPARRASRVDPVQAIHCE